MREHDYYIEAFGENPLEAQHKFDEFKAVTDAFLLKYCDGMLPAPEHITYSVEYTAVDQPLPKASITGHSRESFVAACESVDEALSGKGPYNIGSEAPTDETVQQVQRVLTQYHFFPSRFHMEAAYTLDSKLRIGIELKQRMDNGKTLEDIYCELEKNN